MQTIYIPPPKAQQPRRAKGTDDPIRDVARIVSNYRTELSPFLITWVVVTAAYLTYDMPWAALVYTGVAGACNAVLHLYGPRVRALRQFLTGDSRRQRIRRAYAHSLPWVAMSWLTWATWGVSMPGVRDVAVSTLLTIICASYWWVTLRITRGVRVRLDGLDRAESTHAVADAKTLRLDWTGFTSAAGLHGAKLREITFTRWSVAVAIVVRRGSPTINYTPRMMNRIASASPWTVAPDMARIDRDPTDARKITVRFMLVDPHSAPVPPPDLADMDDSMIEIGLFENADPVVITECNTLIAGETGAGKSGVLNALLRALSRKSTVAIIGIDLKPGAPELGPWEPVMAALAKSNAQAHDILIRVAEELEIRGQMMGERGWKTWRPTPAEPAIAIIIDEIQNLDLQSRKMIAFIAGIIRAMGGYVIVATQYPVKTNLPTEIKANLIQKIGLRTDGPVADRVIFGDNATREGWTPSALCPASRPGSFLIRSKRYTLPMVARAFFIDEDDVPDVVRLMIPMRTTLAFSASPRNAVKTPEISETVYDAVVVSAREQVLSAVGAGYGTPADIAAATEIPKRSVERILSALRSEGIVTQDGARGRYALT